MPAKKYIVSLTEKERQELEELTQKGKSSARKINHARILLKADINQKKGIFGMISIIPLPRVTKER